jgi:hypothetical protein
MPIDPNRRNAIIAAVEAHNRANPGASLPHHTARLLVFMFAASDVCQLSQANLEAEGFGRLASRTLRALVEVGFLSRQAGSARIPDTYQLLLVPVQP